MKSDKKPVDDNFLEVSKIAKKFCVLYSQKNSDGIAKLYNDLDI